MVQLLRHIGYRSIGNLFALGEIETGEVGQTVAQFVYDIISYIFAVRYIQTYQRGHLLDQVE